MYLLHASLYRGVACVFSAAGESMEDDKANTRRNREGVGGDGG